MPIYRQLFNFLCLASIAISVPKTEREETLVPEARDTAKLTFTLLARQLHQMPRFVDEE